MKRYLQTGGVLFLGLFLAQVIATIQVYISNLHLHATLVSVIDAGYFPIPSEQFMPNLLELGPAILGGLFFTLSVGAGLTFISIAAALFWVHLIQQTKIFLITYLILWIGAIFMLNLRGFCPMVTLYFLVIPPVVFLVTVKWAALRIPEMALITRVIHIIPPFLLAIFWATQTSGNLFLEFRDNLLLANSWGTKVNNFYYANTLYPAEAFKSLEQKILKTADLGQIKKEPVVRALERALVNYDYLNVGGSREVDLKVLEDGNKFLFINRGKIILRASLQDFLTETEKVLKVISLKSDRYAFFRQFTFFCLLLGLPLTIYVVLHALFSLLAYTFLSFRLSSVIACIICFILGMSMWIAFVELKGERIDGKELQAALESEDWRRRTSALKTIVHNTIEISDFKNYQRFMTGSHISERFWFVGALGVSRPPETYKMIFTFLDDPHPNVERMALHALGQRGNRAAIPEIKKRIELSDHWFAQWYAYKALRALGWKQVKESK
jgi:hypothetical protein